MGQTLSLELSDGLHELLHQFDDYTHEPRVLAPEDARALQACLKMLRTSARNLENEVSAKRWNEDAARDRLAETSTILAEVHRPGTNVRLFPIIPRPFSDGRPKGGAA